MSHNDLNDFLMKNAKLKQLKKGKNYISLKLLGSLIGGIRETQEVIDLCFKNNIYPDCKIVEAKDIDSCWDQLMNTNADGVRFVIDIKKSLQNQDYIPK